MLKVYLGTLFSIFSQFLMKNWKCYMENEDIFMILMRFVEK